MFNFIFNWDLYVGWERRFFVGFRFIFGLVRFIELRKG